MRRSLLVLAVAIAAFGGALSQATVIDQPTVNDPAIIESGYPKALSSYRFFTDTAARYPNARVSAYELNTPLFSDGADKLRYIYVPQGEAIEADENGVLQFPVGSAIIKTFAFGEGKDQRFIETRVLLHRTEGWVALPYRWNDEQTDATLALAGGRLPITTAAGEEISYRIPNKNQCKTCHSRDGAVIPIGPKLRNMRDSDLALLGVSDRSHGSLPLWSARDRASDVSAYARAYLDVNCAHCHQPGGSASNSGLDLRWEQDDPHAIGIRKPPVAAGRGSGGRAVSIKPGDPDASILLYRMESNEPGVAMPELGRSTVDEEGVAVVRRWIDTIDQEDSSS